LLVIAGKSVYDASLATTSFLRDRPISIEDLCVSSLSVYAAVCSLLYQPAVLNQVTMIYISVM